MTLLRTMRPATYQCPRSGDPLRLEDDVLVSTSGEARYQLRNGVPVFLRYPEAEDEAGRQRLALLNRVARESGWRRALDEAYADDAKLVDYVTNPKRTAFIDELLPLKREHVLLEIGAGLGQLTVPLAERVAEVHGLEVVAGQAEFALERARQSGCENVQIACGGDDCRLPYADGSFDGVVLNLVLEWCGGRCVDRPFVESQKLLLAEISRVLKPGGFAYIVTKNRYAMHYLVGKRDEHARRMRFGNALPRPIMNWALRRRGCERAPGLLHSFNALRRLVRGAGFGRIDAYWAAPEMRFPDRYIPLDAASVRAARREGGFRQAGFRSVNMIMRCVPAALVKHFTHGLVFLATKAEDSASGREA